MLNSMKQGLDKCWTAVRSATLSSAKKSAVFVYLKFVMWVEFWWYQTRLAESWSNQCYADFSQSWRLTEVLGSHNLPVKVHSKHVPDKRSFASAAPERFWMVLGKGYSWNYTGVKKAISSAPVLKFFNSKEPETLSVDASSRGLRAAILQSNHPVAKYASKTLSLS